MFSAAGLATCRAERGAFPEAAAHGANVVHLAEAADHAFSIVQGCIALGHMWLVRGEPDRAIPVLERGLQLCQTWHIAVVFPIVASPLGYAYALAGRVPEWVSLLEEAIEQATARQALGDQPRRLAWLSEAYQLANRPADAARLGSRALQLARQHQERGHEAWALRRMGEIAARADPPEIERAEAFHQQALALAGELGMRPLVAHCHLSLGTLYQKLGRHDEAQAELTTAAEMYRALEMSCWLETAVAALAQVAS